MGRGRAPCCDKSRVVKGPWSPAEDMKLTAFIKKHGHDNWRVLPSQAGLARCGKSCRLRWVNYLCPNVKRGNFNKEEEDTIIQLHQQLGNKWSRIAGYLPGRTDNEIKNVWNTRLKKRLANRATADVPKETSVITSSSSSATVETKSKNHKTEIESQLKLLHHQDSQMKTDETGFTVMGLAPNHQTTVANQVTEVNIGESFNKLHLISQQSSAIHQLEKFILEDDTSLLESMLNEVDPNWLLAPENTQNESTGKNSAFQLPMESDVDLWSMLNNDVMPAPAKPDQKEAANILNVEASMCKKRMNSPYEYAGEKDFNSMFQYLQNETGLGPQSAGLCGNQMQHQKDDVNNSFLAAAAATGSGVDEMSNMNAFTMWPQSPIYY